MPKELPKPIKLLLDPMERISEVLFGLVMVLTTTCSFSIGGGGRTEVRQMLIGALGCTLAWGIVDAVMYLMDRFSAHGREIVALRAVQRAASPSEAHRVIAGAMPLLLALVTSPEALEDMRQGLDKLPEPLDHPNLSKDDWLAGGRVFLVVLAATLPVALPFVFVDDATRAVRVSNGTAIVMLFLTGYAFGYYAGYRPWRMGLGMVLVGSAMVGLTIALGG